MKYFILIIFLLAGFKLTYSQNKRIFTYIELHSKEKDTSYVFQASPTVETAPMSLVQIRTIDSLSCYDIELDGSRTEHHIDTGSVYLVGFVSPTIILDGGKLESLSNSKYVTAFNYANTKDNNRATITLKYKKEGMERVFTRGIGIKFDRGR